MAASVAVVGVNEKVVRHHGVRFLSLSRYSIFRDVGLYGLAPGGTEDPGFVNRCGAPNAAFDGFVHVHRTSVGRMQQPVGLRISTDRHQRRRYTGMPSPGPRTRAGLRHRRRDSERAIGDGHLANNLPVGATSVRLTRKLGDSMARCAALAGALVAETNLRGETRAEIC